MFKMSRIHLSSWVPPLSWLQSRNISPSSRRSPLKNVKTKVRALNPDDKNNIHHTDFVISIITSHTFITSIFNTNRCRDSPTHPLCHKLVLFHFFKNNFASIFECNSTYSTNKFTITLPIMFVNLSLPLPNTTIVQHIKRSRIIVFIFNVNLLYSNERTVSLDLS